MSDFDACDDPDQLPPDHLLDELESIKDILQDRDAVSLTAVPLLDDRRTANLNPNPKLLNLNRIFEEEIERDEKTESKDKRGIEDDALPLQSHCSREALIQELVDAFIPRIEAELRARLDHVETAVLKAWKESK